ncbi:MAG: restriction endonuclease subunit S [bacterium]|nr:restriction endonuclease subunit S [bacterium]
MTREMIDSGIEWIGQVPKNWSIERLQWHLYEVNEKNDPIKTTNILSLTNKLGVVPYSEKGNQGNNAKDNYNEYKIAYPDTIVANSMNILIGSVGYCNYYGCVSPVYYIYRNKENTNLKFINYLFQTQQFQKELRRYANGILEIRLRVSSSDILKRTVALPSLIEQQSIVETLDRKISQIDKLIANQEKQIEKLNEYKQSVITKAVTKGLDLNVEIKDSGVEWIGKYNSNYQIIKMKKITYMKGRIGWQGLTSSDFIDEGPYCITGTDFYNGKVDWSRCYHVSNERYNMDEKIQVKVGDLLITKDGTIGKLAIIDELPNKACLNSHLLIIRPLNNMFINEYLYYVLSSKIFVKYYSLIGSGKTTMNSLSQEQIGDFSFPCPSIDEQLIIANYLSNKCLKINSLLNIKKNKIYKLNEYKKSLIYEYVTGKKQVA